MGAWLDAIAASGGVAKARLGGTSPELFPSTGAVAAWLWATAEAGLEVKATAGLHHALRGDYPVTYETRSPRATMHGFLNVLVGAVLARTLVTTLERATGTSHLEQLLEERDGSMLRVEPEAIGWRGFRLSSEVIARFRSAVLGIGSCSFEEPLAELSALARPAGG
jgi:hypothetical protein